MGTSVGITARQAFRMAGWIISAGNALRASAPASSAAKASVGVATPGSAIRPRALAALTIATSACGMTMRSPPASATAATSLSVLTVPAPISASFGATRRIRRIVSKGCGELSGVSMMWKPASISAIRIGVASSGLIPRRIAASGSFAIASAKRLFKGSPSENASLFGGKRRPAQYSAWRSGEWRMWFPFAIPRFSIPSPFLDEMRKAALPAGERAMSALIRLAKASSRFVACGALAVAMLAGFGVAGAVAEPFINVSIDQAKIAKVPEGTKTLVIGSPIVADVTLLHGSSTMVVTGKGYGETNLIALDGSGNVLQERMIRVEPTGSVLVVQRGMERESYSCTPKCMPVVELGDGSSFSQTSGQITSRNALAAPQQGAK